MNQTQQTQKRKYEKYSLEGNVLKISNIGGTSSVLFEDISSISYNSQYNTNFILTLFGFVISIIGIIYGVNYDNIPFIIIGLILMIGFVIILYMIEMKYDIITIETRGGKLISYSVDFGLGENQVVEIEKLKREITQK